MIWRSSSVQNLLVINSVAGANRCFAVAERIPRYTDSRSEISFSERRPQFAERRAESARSPRRTLRIVLRVGNEAVAEISGTDDAVARTGNQRRLAGFHSSRHKVRQPTVSVLRRAEDRITNAQIKSQIRTKAPFVLNIAFECFLPQIRRVIESRLRKRGVCSEQEVCPQLRGF